MKLTALITLYKSVRKFKELIYEFFSTPYALILLYLNGAIVGSGIKVRGALKVHVARCGSFIVGRGLKINSGPNFNVIGRQQRTIFWVKGNLTIGDNVGISSSAIICNHQISIGDNVMIGGNNVIYDTDFHSIDSENRRSPSLDKAHRKWAPVVIGNDVFIGAHSTILKGVTIGSGAVIGACSVVTKNIPSNEVWAGNPAIFVKKLRA